MKIFDLHDVSVCLAYILLLFTPQILIFIRHFWEKRNWRKINKLIEIRKNTPSLSNEMAEKLDKDISRRTKLDRFFDVHLDTDRRFCKNNWFYHIFIFFVGACDVILVFYTLACLVMMPCNYLEAKSLPRQKIELVEEFYKMEYPSFEKIKEAEALNNWPDKGDNQPFVTKEYLEELRADKIDTIKMMAHLQNKVNKEIVQIAGESK